MSTKTSKQIINMYGQYVQNDPRLVAAYNNSNAKKQGMDIATWGRLHYYDTGGAAKNSLPDPMPFLQAGYQQLLKKAGGKTAADILGWDPMAVGMAKLNKEFGKPGAGSPPIFNPWGVNITPNATSGNINNPLMPPQTQASQILNGGNTMGTSPWGGAVGNTDPNATVDWAHTTGADTAPINPLDKTIQFATLLAA